MAINSFKVKNSLNVAPQATAPSSPALGDVYVDLLGNYFRWSGTAWTSLGSAGSGGINYLINSNKAWNFDDGASTGWGVYADAAGVAPVDGTGGSPNVTFAASATTPLRGAYSGLFTKDAANRQGQGVSVDFTLDTQDIGKPFTFSFDTSASAAFTGASGTESARVYCYDVTNATMLPGYVDISPGSSTTKGFFVATSSTSYRFIIHVSGTGTAAWTLKIDQVVIGQQTIFLGTAISGFTNLGAMTITGNGTSPTKGTVKVDNVSYRRVGDCAEIMFYYLQQGAGSGGTSTQYYFNIPSSIGTADLNYHFTSGSPIITDYDEETALVGTCEIRDGNLTPNHQTGGVFLINSTQVSCRIPAGLVGNSVGALSTARIAIGIIIRVKIAEWSSNITMADRAVEEFAYNTSTATTGNDTTSFGYGAAGQRFYSVTATGTRRVRFQTPIQPTDLLTVEIFDGVGWSPASEAGIITSGVQKLQVQNGVSTGIDIIAIVNATDVDVRIGQFPNANSTYGAGGAAWSTILSTILWRVRKIAGGALVGFPIGQANIVYDPTTVGDSNATLVGQKQYYHGTNYNGGNAPTITLSGVTVTGTINGTFVPYKMQDGVWRMRFNMRISPTNGTAISGNTFNVIVNGVTYRNVSGFSQAVSATTSTAATTILNYYHTQPNTSNIKLNFSTSGNYNSTDYYISGDVELDSKPTWAY